MILLKTFFILDIRQNKNKLFYEPKGAGGLGLGIEEGNEERWKGRYKKKNITS
jgi:hypothetical protein